MDGIRVRTNYDSHIFKMDITNGVTLLQKLPVVAPEKLIFNSVASTEADNVCAHLDKHGSTTREKISGVCDELTRFPRCDGGGEDSKLLKKKKGKLGVNISPFPLGLVDVWSLTGFVVLVAVT